VPSRFLPPFRAERHGFCSHCLVMLAYGWTFNLGFFNYYLSLGLGFFAIAIV